MTDKSKMDISEETLNIVKSAITLARNEQITTTDSLRKRLNFLYPNKDAEINEALIFWANNPS